MQLSGFRTDKQRKNYGWKKRQRRRNRGIIPRHKGWRQSQKEIGLLSWLRKTVEKKEKGTAKIERLRGVIGKEVEHKGFCKNFALCPLFSQKPSVLYYSDIKLFFVDS